MLEHVDPETDHPVIDARDMVPADATRLELAPFFARQVRGPTENFGKVHPETLDDYGAAGGFGALRRVHSEMTSA